MKMTIYLSKIQPIWSSLTFFWTAACIFLFESVGMDKNLYSRIVSPPGPKPYMHGKSAKNNNIHVHLWLQLEIVNNVIYWDTRANKQVGKAYQSLSGTAENNQN